MEHDKALNVIQVMPFVEGRIALTSGTIGNTTLIQCNTDGDLTLTFPSGNTKEVSMLAGTHRSIAKGSTITILSGSFDFD